MSVSLLAVLAALLAVTAAAEPRSLVSWLGALPGAQLGPVELRPSVCGDGRGVFLTEPVADGALLFRLPESAMLSLRVALADPAIGGSLAELWSASDDRGVALMAALLAHLELSDPSHPYFRMLPKREDQPRHPRDPSHPSSSRLLGPDDTQQNHVLWWSDEEVELLRGTAAYAECASLRAECEAACASLCAGPLAADVCAHDFHVVAMIFIRPSSIA